MEGKTGFEDMQVDAFVFQRPPEPLNEHVVHPAASAIHADLDVRIREHLSKLNTLSKSRGHLSPRRPCLVRNYNTWASLSGLSTW